MTRVTCYLIGQSQMLTRCADLLSAADVAILGIISEDSHARAYAEAKGIPAMAWHATLADQLAPTPFDYLFSIINFHVLPPALLRLPRRGTLNFHDGPLPRYAGSHVVAWAIAEGASHHGVTWHWVAEKVDAGAIVAESRFPIREKVTALSLSYQSIQVGIELFETLVPQLEKGLPAGTPMAIEGRAFYPRARRIANGGILDFNRPAAEVERLVYALDYGVFANPLSVPKLMTPAGAVLVRQARAVPQKRAARATTVTGITTSQLRIACSEGDILLSDFVTMEGAAINSEAVAQRLQFRQGDRLPPPDEAMLEKIAHWMKQTTRHEDWWRNRLTGIVPPHVEALPFSAARSHYHRFYLDVAAQIEPTEDLDALNLTLLTAFLATVVERIGNTAFDIAFTPRDYVQQLDNTAELFATFLPLHVETDVPATTPEAMHSFRQRLAANIEEIRAHVTYPKDLEMRLGHRVRPQGENLPPYVQVMALQCASNDVATVAQDTEIVLICNTDKPQQPRLFIRETMMTEAEAEAFGHSVSAHFTQLRTVAVVKAPVVEVAPAPTPRPVAMPPLTVAAPTILDMFEEARERYRDTIALEHEGIALTYDEIAHWSWQIAQKLAVYGVERGDAVALLADRDEALPAALLGILRAGAAFVPLDPEHPLDRLRYICETAGCQTVLASPRMAVVAESLGITVRYIPDRHAPAAETRHAAPRPPRATDLAYILFTSGSTGKPKGVEVEHRALHHFMQSIQQRVQLSAHDTLLAVTTISFDISILELVLPLTVGAKIHLVASEASRVARTLIGKILSSRATVMQATPSTWRMLLENRWVPETGFKVLSGGEALAPKVAEPLVESGAEVWNLYGPTEATIWASAQRLKSRAPYISIGKPLPGMAFHLLDEQLRPVPDGAEGHLYLSGEGLARGYANRPDLTAAAFMTDPSDPTRRLYRTGDIVRRHHDGGVEWLARADYQVKVRGYRIELGEIEGALEQLTTVHQAVVIARQDAQDNTPQLVAYLRTQADAMVTRSALIEHLELRLPDYMIPALFMLVEQFPLTANGKVDRAALPVPHRDIVITDTPRRTPTPAIVPEPVVSSPSKMDDIVQAPLPMVPLRYEDIEARLCACFEQILNVGRIEPTDNFFLLGGDSVSVEVLAARMSEALRVPMNASLVFACPTPRQLATQVVPVSDDSETPMVAVEPAAPMRREAVVEPMVAPVMSTPSTSTANDVAIVGIGCRFPDARTPDDFWANLRAARDGIATPPAERRGWSTLFDRAGDGFRNGAGRWQGWLDRVEYFDTDYFNIPAREARRMDPLQRQMLSVAAEAVESAGYHPDDLKAVRTAVFVGVIASEFPDLLAEIEGHNDAHAASGSAISMVANRLSYVFGWNGPSLALDTACSSSLVALHLAVQGLRAGQFDAALVGGVNLIHTPTRTQSFAKAGMLSPDGHCFTFDQSANGYVRGEGVGAIVVKRLADAERDGDPILAVVKGSAINHDGGAKGFLTAPNMQAQVNVLRDAWKDAGIAPTSLSYLEAHGTGTALGDPIEVDALRQAFGKDAPRATCAIGSVKSNMGHLEPAAGIAGIIKSVLALQAQELPPTLHITTPNTRITFEDSPFYINDRLRPWHTDSARSVRRAGVSSFGFGGANAHIVLEEASTRPVASEIGPFLLPIAAQSAEGLRERVRHYQQIVSMSPALDLAALCATAQRGRHGTHRMVLLVESLAQVEDKLSLYLLQSADAPTQIRSVEKNVIERQDPSTFYHLNQEARRTLSAVAFDLWQAVCDPVRLDSPALSKVPMAERMPLLRFVARAYTLGQPLVWERLVAHPAARVRIAPCPLEEQYCWLTPPTKESITAPAILGTLHVQETWQLTTQEPVVGQHIVEGTATLPGAAYLYKAVQVVRAVIAAPTLSFHQVGFQQPTRVTATPLALAVEFATDNVQFGLPDATIATQLTVGQRHTLSVTPSVPLGHGARAIPSDALYQRFTVGGLEYGTAFRVVQSVTTDGTRAHGTLMRQSGTAPLTTVWADPYLLDGAFQIALAPLVMESSDTALYIPFFIEAIEFHQPLGNSVSVDSQLHITAGSQPPFVRGDITLYHNSRVAVVIRGMTWKQIAAPPRATLTPPTVSVPKVAPLPTPAPLPVPNGALAQATPMVMGTVFQRTRTHLMAWIAEGLEIAVDLLETDRPLLEQGMDSLLAVSLIQDIQEQLDLHLPATLILEVGTVDALARELVDVYGYNGGGSTPPPPTPPVDVLARNEQRSAVEPSVLSGATHSNMIAVSDKRAGENWEPASDARPLTSEHLAKDTRIAVIGMEGIFPKARHLSDLWTNLREGRDCITEVPSERWDVNAYRAADSNALGSIYARWGGFVEDVDEFDPAFFRITPADAQWLDPQQRQLLQVVWRTLENAGVAYTQLQGSRTGVFVAASYNHYRDQVVGDVVPTAAGLGNHNAILANRLSYFLDLKGPCLTVDTLCSSSLVALHMATRSLRSGECDYALVAGVHLEMSPQYYQMACRLRSFSPTGRCRTFDDGADGFVPGEGVGVILLRRLEDAQREGDPIQGVILGTAVNHGGRTSGLTVPSSAAQRDVVLAALEDANVRPETVSYVEAHGTGTSLGDPIEIDGLTAAYRRSTALRQFCAIGSVKTNIGHLEPAAGITSLIKVMLAFNHEELPPSIHLDAVNARIFFEETPFYINTELQPWQRGKQPRRAGISAFGMGGVNAHVVVEEAPALSVPQEESPRQPHILRVNAVEADTLRTLAQQYATHLKGLTTAQAVADMCYTANTGRGSFRQRVAVVGQSGEELIRGLQAVADGSQPIARLASQPALKAFLYTGQGSQYPAMGRDLYLREPVFRAALEECAALLVPHLDQPLPELLYGSATADLDQTAYAQVGIVAVQVALTRLLASWGIQPDMVLGHSIGEYTAAWVAGVIDLPALLRLVAIRGRLMQAQPRGGAMAVLRAPAATVEAALVGVQGVEIAAYNSPQSTVVAGDAAAVTAFCERVGIPHQRLRVSHAFHSEAMAGAMDGLAAAWAQTTSTAPTLPLISNLSGGWHDAGSVADSAAWSHQMRQAVRYAAGIEQLVNAGARVLWEIGAQPTLSVLGQQVLAGRSDLTWLTTLRQGKAAPAELLPALSRYYSEGHGEVNWHAVETDPARRKVALPTYPFHRARYKATPVQRTTPLPVATTAIHPLFGNMSILPPSNGNGNGNGHGHSSGNGNGNGNRNGKEH